MLVTGDYRRVQIGFQPFAEKPPLFMWVRAVDADLWRRRIRGAPAECHRGIVTLVGIYIVGRQLFDRRLALWWALAL